jgi:H+/Cl- antiporter ClcA
VWLYLAAGIVEVKSCLNGIELPRVLRMRTLVTKVIGIIFAQASGLPLGTDAPLCMYTAPSHCICMAFVCCTKSSFVYTTKVIGIIFAQASGLPLGRKPYQ